MFQENYLVTIRTFHSCPYCALTMGPTFFSTTAASAKLETKDWLNYYQIEFHSLYLDHSSRNYQCITNAPITKQTTHQINDDDDSIFVFIRCIKQTAFITHKCITQIHDPYQIDNRKPFKFALNFSSIKNNYY